MKRPHGWVPAILGALFVWSGIAYGSSRIPDPISYVSELEDPVIHTPSHRIHSASQFDITFTLHDRAQRFKLHLEPNPDVLGHGPEIEYLGEDGTTHRSETINQQDHRVFKGTAWTEERENHWTRVGWARIYIKRDGKEPLFEGAFSVMHDHHHIKLRSRYLRTRQVHDVLPDDKGHDYMVVFRDSDMIPNQTQLKRSEADYACHADKLPFNADPNHPVYQAPQTPNIGAMSLGEMLGLYRRQSDTIGAGNSGGVNLASTIGSTAGCPKMKKVALIGIATDCSYTANFDTEEDLRQDVIQMVNTASNLYEETFNISIGLRNLVVSKRDCPTTPSQSTPWNTGCNQGNITSRLEQFTAWRGGRDDDNAYWTLMSACPTGDEVGLAWLGQLCNRGGSDSTVAGANVVAITQNQWQVFAHETGHTFGAVHDCTSSACAQGLQRTSQCCPLSRDTCDADGQFVMNPTASERARTFSQCTVGNICSALGRNSVNSNCLVDNRGVVTIQGSQCGNGIVEEGEECDCGGEDGCGDNPCCDARTCRFRDGAVCDDSNEECCSNCQFASSNTVCRASTGPCDPEERCTGRSGSCPPDQHLDDGASCGDDDGLTCASGQCTSRDLQCQQIMGAVLGSNDTSACDSNSCQIFCASPVLGNNVCGSVNQNFLDGTPCSGDGRCHNGRCEGATTGGQIRSWIDNNRALVIGLGAGLGGLILLGILSGILSYIRRRRRMRYLAVQQSAPPVVAAGWPGRPPSQAPLRESPLQSEWNGPYPPAYQPYTQYPPYPAPPPRYG